jgi:carbamoyl-phosphate synthase small subunit
LTRIALEDGLVLVGKGFGAAVDAEGEVVFNTSMFGYQEILTDPSYAGQILTMTSPEIGNVGTNPDDEESDGPKATAMVVRELCTASNYRNVEGLGSYLERTGVAGIEAVDTRKLVRHLRAVGSLRGVVSSEPVSDKALIARAQQVPSMEGRDLATALSVKTPQSWASPVRSPIAPPELLPHANLHVVAYDYGLKRAMLDELVRVGCRVTIVPSAFPAADTLALAPHGVLLTNGPGDPSAVVGARAVVEQLLGKVPMLGICLGHQILALAAGGRTYKMKFGHRGANHPVMEASTRRIDITAQNHGFAVDAASLPKGVQVSHTNLNDGTVEGLTIVDARALSVQHHPEASPGPQEARSVFRKFRTLMIEAIA